MRIACVDGSKEILQRVGALLGEYGEKNNVLINCDYHEDPQAFLGAIADTDYDVVFMDICFDGQEMTGMEAARMLRQKDPHCIIIFLTSSAEHMAKAFEVHAFSYILKEDIEGQIGTVMGDVIKVLPQAKSLTILKGQKELAVPHHRLICVYTDGHYLNLRILGSAPLRIRMTFRDLLAQLEQEGRFLQINKGVLVNMDHIQSIEEGVCTMVDGTLLPVRHRGRSDLIDIWREHQLKEVR